VRDDGEGEEGADADEMGLQVALIDPMTCRSGLKKQELGVQARFLGRAQLGQVVVVEDGFEFLSDASLSAMRAGLHTDPVCASPCPSDDAQAHPLRLAVQRVQSQHVRSAIRRSLII
jgi:hypothetical protein